MWVPSVVYYKSWILFAPCVTARAAISAAHYGDLTGGIAGAAVLLGASEPVAASRQHPRRCYGL